MTSASISLPDRATVGVRARRAPAPYLNPYLTGTGLGLVLLATFIVMGHGLGASGAFVSAVTAALQAVAPEHIARNAFFAVYRSDSPSSTLKTWLVFEMIGVSVGGAISAWLAGRLRGMVDRGPRIGMESRLRNAVAGGAIMGFATRLARGCTSGQGLTGGASLNVGSWLFLVSVFAGAYAVARLVRREWT